MVLESKDYSELFVAYCNDTRITPTTEARDKFVNIVSKHSTDTKLVAKSCRIGKHTAYALLNVLKENVTIRSIDLHENVIRESGCRSIVELLESEFVNVENLNIGSNDIAGKGIEPLCDFLENNEKCKLRKLILGSGEKDLYANRIEGDMALRLAEAIYSNETLEVLCLNRNPLGKKSQKFFKAFAPALANAAHLTSIRLGEVRMGTHSAVNLLNALIPNNNLMYLDLHGNNLGWEIAQPLMEILGNQDTRLSVLLLQQNNIGVKGIDILSDGIEDNPNTLTILNLGDNDLTDDGAVIMSQVISENQSIINLDLSNNDIWEEGCVLLADALHKNKVLSTLNLSKNKLHDQGVAALGIILETHLSLENIDLSLTNTGDAGAVTVFQALATNTSLKKLNLSSNHMTEASGIAACATLKKNRTLRSLMLTGNQIDHTTNLSVKKQIRMNQVLRNAEKPNMLEKQIIRLNYITSWLQNDNRKLEDAVAERRAAQAKLAAAKDTHVNTREKYIDQINTIENDITHEENAAIESHKKIDIKEQEMIKVRNTFGQKLFDFNDVIFSTTLKRKIKAHDIKNLEEQSAALEDTEKSVADLQQQLDEAKQKLEEATKKKDDTDAEIQEMKKQIAKCVEHLTPSTMETLDANVDVEMQKFKAEKKKKEEQQAKDDAQAAKDQAEKDQAELEAKIMEENNLKYPEPFVPVKLKSNPSIITKVEEAATDEEKGEEEQGEEQNGEEEQGEEEQGGEEEKQGEDEEQTEEKQEKEETGEEKEEETKEQEEEETKGE
mmetsp:Transcript_3744/g.5536  ORF Transcript_3744/g.5536 Transcript_3744/m.5536 type:complete len:781 (+) Transcript_3744:71-2413(+)